MEKKIDTLWTPWCTDNLTNPSCFQSSFVTDCSPSGDANPPSADFNHSIIPTAGADPPPAATDTKLPPLMVANLVRIPGPVVQILAPIPPLILARRL